MKTLLLLLISGITWGACDTPPYANGYSFCREIVVDHTKVTATQTNFPMLVCFDPSMGANCSTNRRELATAANGGKLLNANGFDFIFTSDSAGSTPIAYERAIQNLSTGAAELWVLIASLSSSVDTKIYLFYGKGSITTDQSNRTAVWDANYIAVNHFDTLSGNESTEADSTSNGNTLTLDGLPSTILGGSGQIGGAAVWADVATMANTSPTGMPSGSGTRTLEAWVNTTDTGFKQTINCIGNNSVDGRYAIWLNDSPSLWGVEGANVAATFATGPGGWQHIVITLPGGSTTFMGTVPYVNGVQKTLSNLVNWTDTVNTVIGDYRIGGACGLGGQFVAAMGASVDETRVSNIARSADWIATEYNNQSSPNTFYSVSTQVPPNSFGGRTIIIN